MILTVFSLQRRLIVDGSHSVEHTTYSAIVAGSVFSCAVLHIVLLWPCDKLLQLFPTISLAKYVDDISLSTIGASSEVAKTLPAATAAFIELLEEDLDMPVSRRQGAEPGKSVVMTSHPGLKASMQQKMLRLGLRFEARARNLGVDCYGAGKVRGPSVRTQRMRSLREKARRLTRLKRCGARVKQVARCGLKPSVLYGVKCLGLADRHVQSLRKATSACLPGRHTAKSTTLRLAVHRAEVQHECAAAPLTEWASAVWDGYLPATLLKKAWYQQVKELGLKPKWSKVRGPAGACIMMMRKIGWKWPRYDFVLSWDGLPMPLDRICPQDVK
eukprot:5376204-Karenia_brevis.AAC.1